MMIILCVFVAMIISAEVKLISILKFSKMIIANKPICDYTDPTISTSLIKIKLFIT